MDVYTAATRTFLGMTLLDGESPQVTLVSIDDVEDADLSELKEDPPEVEFSPRPMRRQSTVARLPGRRFRA